MPKDDMLNAIELCEVYNMCTTKIAYYRDGMLYDCFPRDSSLSLYEDRQTAYDASIIVSDDITYDLNTCEGWNNLPIPNFAALKGSFPTILEISYILKMHCGIISTPSLIPSAVSKTLAIMQASTTMNWRRGDYLQVIRCYYQNGLFETGDNFEISFRTDNPSIFLKIEDEKYEEEHEKKKLYFRQKWFKHEEYRQICELLPDIAPSSCKGYLQMRAKRTKHFFEIKEAAEAVGIKIDLVTVP